jgi:hypothetical protein
MPSVKYVTRPAFEALWKSYIFRPRQIAMNLNDRGIDSLWHYDEKCFWAVHPEELDSNEYHARGEEV